MRVCSLPRYIRVAARPLCAHMEAASQQQLIAGHQDCATAQRLELLHNVKIVVRLDGITAEDETVQKVKSRSRVRF